MKPASSFPQAASRGVAQVILLAYLVGFVAAGVVGWKITHPKIDAPKTELKADAAALAVATKKVDTTRDAITAENDQQAKAVQQLDAATKSALDGASPAAKADVHVALASRLSAKSVDAGAAAFGPLTPEQQEWVDRLIQDATSASDQRRAAAESQLQQSSQALQESVGREAKLKTDLSATVTERDGLQTKLATAIDQKNGLAALARQLGDWLLWIGIGAAIIFYVLPLAAKTFPALAPLADGLHALIAPLFAKAKAEAESLGQDASSALHHVTALIEEKAPALVAEAQKIKSDWITEADGTASRFDAALRTANVI